jgi:glycosyltransferase involved in cell wall biosynthesis
MNILLIAYNVNINSRTGDAVHVRELVSNIASMGARVSLVVGFDENQKEDISYLENNPNIDIYYPKISKFKYPRSEDISILSLCLDINKKINNDIIYERGFSCKIGAILSKILGKPLVVEVNGLRDEEARIQGKHTPLPKKIIKKKLQTLFFVQTSKIVAVTPGIKRELSKQYNVPSNKIDIISNGTDFSHFKPMNKREVKEELKLSHENKYICFVGHLAPWQGVDCLIKAAPIVLKKVPEAKFLIVGDGIMREEWEKMTQDLGISEYFLFVGSVPFSIVPKYINASDVCVVPKKILKSGY